MRPFIVFSTFDMDQLGQKSIDTTGKSALKLVPHLKLIRRRLRSWENLQTFVCWGGGQVCAPPPLPIIQTSDTPLMSYIFVNFQQSPSNLAVLMIYSEDDGLSLTCPPCLKKAEKKSEKHRGRCINWPTITITIIYLPRYRLRAKVLVQNPNVH